MAKVLGRCIGAEDIIDLSFSDLLRLSGSAMIITMEPLLPIKKNTKLSSNDKLCSYHEPVHKAIL